MYAGSFGLGSAPLWSCGVCGCSVVKHEEFRNLGFLSFCVQSPHALHATSQGAQSEGCGGIR